MSGIACVIMASGVGSRFGGNKLLAPFAGAPLLCRAFDMTEGLFGPRVLVTRYEACADLARERGVAAVVHDLPLRSDTVRLGIEAVPGTRGCLFLPGDQPLLTRDTLRRLKEAFEAEPDRVCRVSWQGEGGSPVLFPARCYAELACLPPGKGGGVLLRREPERVRLVEAASAAELMDVDTREDLIRLEGYRQRE